MPLNRSGLRRVLYILLLCLMFFTSCQSHSITLTPISVTMPQTPYPPDPPRPSLAPSRTPIQKTATAAASLTTVPSDSWEPTPIPYTPQPTIKPPDLDHLEVINRTNLTRLTEIWRYESSPDKEGRGFEFGPDGKTIVLDKTISADVWDLRAGRVVQSYFPPEINSKKGYVGYFTFSPDGRKLAMLSQNGFLVLDAKSGKLLSQQVDFPDTGGEITTSFLFSPDGNWLVSTAITMSCDTRIWSAQTGRLLKSLNNGNQVDADFSSDGKWLYISGKGDVHVWDTSSWKDVSILSVPGGSNDLKFSENGKIALISESDSGNGPEWLGIYSVKNWKLIGTIEDRYGEGGVMKPIATIPDLNKDGGIVMYSPGGENLGEGSNQIEFWDTQTQKRLLLFDTHLPAPIERTLFSPDGRLVAVSMNNGTILFYGVHTLNQ
jgi:WD40 repeat protein